MSARTRHRWLAWLLPLIALRALLPAGFMLMWADGMPQLMLCSGRGPVSVLPQGPRADAQHAHHDAHALGHSASVPTHSSSPSHESSLCPFAGGGVAHVAALPVVPGVLALATDPPAAIAYPEPASAAVLIDRIRGPPLA